MRVETLTMIADLMDACIKCVLDLYNIDKTPYNSEL